MGMRTIGKRSTPPITFDACGRSLLDGARFNDQIHRLPTGGRTRVPKGVYRYRTHEERNRADEAAVVAAMAEAARQR